ncbi:hypothetical protein RSSM_06200 [Rhodopirellula sallentina SM41]|uniref:Uncharacterized protein n=1 Tax=Rhodopirellula sallentina SM41 TaxID=1263870 RepID=M5TTH1_9BACT|nr:hypothetical protein RSSM_06200 [Rhodopirellula sallentina SM41]
MGRDQISRTEIAVRERVANQEPSGAPAIFADVKCRVLSKVYACDQVGVCPSVHWFPVYFEA